MQHMSRKTNAMLLSCLILMSGCAAFIGLTDSSDAASETWSSTQYDSRTLNVQLGESVTLTFENGATGSFSYIQTVGNYPSWMSLSLTPHRVLSGTASTAGTFTVSVTWEKVRDSNGSVSESHSYTVTINVIAPTYTHTLSYDANGGSAAPSTQSVTDTNASLGMTVSSAVPVRDGYTFLGWSTNSSATAADLTGGSTLTVGNDTVTLYAVWKININVEDITVLSGDTVYLTPVLSGNVSVSGASWLSAQGNAIYGTAPATAGNYEVTVSCENNSETFTITVVSALAPTNSPSNGVVIFVKG